MRIPKPFLVFAAYGQTSTAEALWDHPQPKLGGRTPNEAWNDSSLAPFALCQRRRTIIAICRGEAPTPEEDDTRPLFGTVPDNGKNTIDSGFRWQMYGGDAYDPLGVS